MTMVAIPTPSPLAKAIFAVSLWCVECYGQQDVSAHLSVTCLSFMAFDLMKLADKQSKWPYRVSPIKLNDPLHRKPIIIKTVNAYLTCLSRWDFSHLKKRERKKLLLTHSLYRHKNKRSRASTKRVIFILILANAKIMDKIFIFLRSLAFAFVRRACEQRFN